MSETKNGDNFRNLHFSTTPCSQSSLPALLLQLLHAMSPFLLLSLGGSLISAANSLLLAARRLHFFAIHIFALA